MDKTITAIYGEVLDGICGLKGHHPSFITALLGYSEIPLTSCRAESRASLVDTSNQPEFQRFIGGVKLLRRSFSRNIRFKLLLLMLLQNYVELIYTSVTHHSKLVKSENLTALKQDPITFIPILCRHVG
jgi:hypothetical protein